LTVNDIRYDVQPAESPVRRLTLHHFADFSSNPFFVALARPNSDVRMPQDDRQWPPALILDYFYGCAALKAWGQTSFVELVRKFTKDTYYAKSKQSAEVAARD
jgi:hypothetical protein